MKIPTVSILQFLKFLAFIAFIGYAIEAGSIIISFMVSFFNPEAAKNLYKGLDLYELKQSHAWLYYLSVGFLAAIAIMKSTVWQLAFKMLLKLNIGSPFKPEMTRMLEKISYTLFSIWIVGLIANILTEFFIKTAGEKMALKFSIDEFLFMAGLVYVISQIFKRGIEMQSENELTV